MAKNYGGGMKHSRKAPSETKKGDIPGGRTRGGPASVVKGPRTAPGPAVVAVRNRHPSSM